MGVKEYICVTNDCTYKFKISGYSRDQAKEIIVSGIRGYRNKIERRKREGQPFYNLQACQEDPGIKSQEEAVR